jgi:hypothetical protein
MPGRTIGDQCIPSPAPPAFGDAAPLDHQMPDASPAKMLAHCNARLTGTDDNYFCLFDLHQLFLL